MLWCIVPVTFALACAFAIIWMLSRDRLALSGPVPEPPAAGVHPYNRRHTIKGLVILALVVVTLFSPLPKEIVALTAAGIHLASPRFSFGGSLIILGSVSNIIVVQRARELGIAISFRDFARLGVPVTLAALGGLIAWITLVT